MCVPYMWYNCVHHGFITLADIQHSFTSNHPVREVGRNPKSRVMSALCPVVRMMWGKVFILGDSLQNAPCGIRREERSVSVRLVVDTARYSKLAVNLESPFIEFNRLLDVPKVSLTKCQIEHSANRPYSCHLLA